MRNSTWTCGIGALFVCAGCQTVSLPNPELESARESYRTAQADPRVQRYAPVELNRARETLQHAEAEMRENGNTALAAHLAYIARQRALMATELGVHGYAEEQIKTANARRDELIAQAGPRDSGIVQGPSADTRTQPLTPEQRAARLQAELAALQARNTDRGIVVTLSDAAFDVDSARLRSSADPTLDTIANALRENPERRVMIEAFTDSQGLDSHNLELSARRAGTVRQALVDRGISAQRIEAQGLGEAFPIATNSTSAGRQSNRRVEILFSDTQGRLVSRPMRGSYGSRPQR